MDLSRAIGHDDDDDDDIIIIIIMSHVVHMLIPDNSIVFGL